MVAADGTPSWKAPGTPSRPGMADNSAEMLHPRPKNRNQQRSGVRASKNFAFGFSMFIICAFVIPSYGTPFYVRYVANQDWIEKAKKNVASFWVTRNARDHYYYMTQRKNTMWEMMGMKKYNIGGDENDGEVMAYRHNVTQIKGNDK